EFSRRTLDAQAVAERRFRTMFEGAPVGLVLVDEQGIFQMVNPAYGRMVGREPDDIVGHHVRGWAVPLGGDQTGVYLEELLAGQGGSHTAERHRVLADGTKRLGRVTTTQYVDGRDGRRYHIAIVQDVTEERAMQAELRDREEQLRQAQK